MDATLSALPIIIIGVFIALYDPILGLIVMLIGLLAFLVLSDPSHGYVALYLLIPMIVFLMFAWAFWDIISEEYRIIAVLVFVFGSLALAATAGHDYNGLIFSPMFIIPIGLGLLYDPTGRLAVIAAVVTYVPYSLMIYYVVRSVHGEFSHPMIGKTGIVVETVNRNGGKIKIGNTYRDAVSSQELKPGTKVVVTDIDEDELKLFVVPAGLWNLRRA